MLRIHEPAEVNPARTQEVVSPVAPLNRQNGIGTLSALECLTSLTLIPKPGPQPTHGKPEDYR